MSKATIYLFALTAGILSPIINSSDVITPSPSSSIVRNPASLRETKVDKGGKFLKNNCNCCVASVGRGGGDGIQQDNLVLVYTTSLNQWIALQVRSDWLLKL